MMQAFIKNSVERLSGDQVWLERSADFSRLAEFVHSVRPRATTTPLVRIGKPGDGGYLLPDDLEGMKILISPGVSTEVTFDSEMSKRGLHSFMADASVDGPPVNDPNFHFFKKFVDVHEDNLNMRLDSLCQKVPPELDGDRILQMDIEGAEYRVLLDLDEDNLKKFRIMVVEFHHLTRLFGEWQMQIISATFRKLLRHHYVVHIHPNNVAPPTQRGGVSIPPVMEFTFHRKDRTTLVEGGKCLIPNPLDADNLPHRPAVVLPECWR